MSSKDNISQRPLFSDWPAWHEFPSEVQRQATELLANMYLEALDSSEQQPTQEQLDDLQSDQTASS
jgi:hypothetical protein